MTSPKSADSPRRRFSPSVRREMLMDVAEKLFIEHGYAAVTIEDIAQEAGVTRPVVYNHFKSREGVYISCVERARDSFDAEVLESLDPDGHPKEMIAAGGDLFFRILERDPGRWLLLFGGNTVLPSSRASELSDLRFRTIDAIAIVLRRAFPKATPRRIEAFAHAVSGVGERLGHWWLQNPKMRRRDLVEHYTEILWAGLRDYADHGSDD